MRATREITRKATPRTSGRAQKLTQAHETNGHAQKLAEARTRLGLPAASGSEPLVGSDRSLALGILVDECSVVADCRRLNIEQAEAALEKLARSPHFNHIGGDAILVARDDGLVVSKDNRWGVIPWLDVAQRFCAESIAGEADLRDDEPPRPQFVERMVPLTSIATSKLNPRTEFDEVKLAELAESIKTHGILEPLLVRPIDDGRPHKYELVVGERRLRAAKLAIVVEVPVRVANLTEREADEIRIVENLQREDLSAIEEARAFRGMLERHGYTQEALAQKLGVSQPHIANRLRLLKLPKAWQERVISGEIPLGHALDLIPYVDSPGAVKAISALLKDDADEIPVQRAGFASFVRQAIVWDSRAIEDKRWCSAVGRQIPTFKPTEEQRQQLDLVTVRRRNGKQEERAMNQSLWRKLQDAHEKAYVAKHGKEKKAPKGEGRSREPTAAEKKAAAKKQAQQFAKRLDEWRTNWLRWLLHTRVLESGNLALAAVAIKLATHDGGRAEPKRLADLVWFEGKATRSEGWRSAPSEGLVRAIAGSETPVELLVQTAADWLWDTNEPRLEFNREQCEALAAAAGIDLDNAWAHDLAGPWLTAAYFNLHNKEQLIGLADELALNELDACTPARSKAELVEILMQSGCTGETMPEEIKRVVPLDGAKKKPAAKKAAATKAKTQRKGAKAPRSRA